MKRWFLVDLMNGNWPFRSKWLIEAYSPADALMQAQKQLSYAWRGLFAQRDKLNHVPAVYLLQGVKLGEDDDGVNLDWKHAQKVI